MSKKQRRFLVGGSIVVLIGVALKVFAGFGGIAIAGYFIGSGLGSLGLGIAYGLGTYSANMSESVKGNAS